MMEQHEAQPQRKPAAETRPAEAGESTGDRLAAEVQALTRLNEASSRLWHLSDLQAGLEQILAAAVALLGAEKGLVQLLDDDGVLRLGAQQGFDEALLDLEASADHCLHSTPIVSRDGRQDRKS